MILPFASVPGFEKICEKVAFVGKVGFVLASTMNRFASVKRSAPTVVTVPTVVVFAPTTVTVKAPRLLLVVDMTGGLIGVAPPLVAEKLDSTGM